MSEVTYIKPETARVNSRSFKKYKWSYQDFGKSVNTAIKEASERGLHQVQIDYDGDVEFRETVMERVYEDLRRLGYEVRLNGDFTGDIYGMIVSWI